MQLKMVSNKPTVILVVDDNQDNLELQAYQVSILIHCSVIKALDGCTALSLAAQFRPNLILLDVMLPDMDGFQVVRELKQNPLTNQIPVVAVTAMARSLDEELAFEAGYDAYLRKPYDLESLEAVIYRYLRTSCPSSI